MDISVVNFWSYNFVVLVYVGRLSFSKGKYQCFITKGYQGQLCTFDFVSQFVCDSLQMIATSPL